MNENTAIGDSIEVILRQLGATKIRKIRSYLYFIEFQLSEEWKVTYSYNINTKDEYFLQRIKPYPIPQGVFSDEYEVVSFITQDLKKFVNAKNSSNFPTFVEVTRKVNSINDEMEKLFLNYNVETDDLENLNSKLDNIFKNIEDARNNSKQL
ncbi:hypothetical protein NSA24_06630 [Clostridioides mangenotii]|uniref:hypothetical protein n=1 Tax=Metaclostridioides mangenotii TaxID=1540 RepID=UPI002149F697|nr:hypothetical protein [Clostridioides mangenotii]MCR1954467.1 hypothetical protein [Clostridioides mangenotii]